MTAPVIIDTEELAALSAEARETPRGRKNRNLHQMDDAIHRLLNATEPRTYVQPHRHLTPPRHETLSVIAGRGAVVCFDDAGGITNTIVLGPNSTVRAIELPAGCWHTLVALDIGTVWLEVKAGPYVAPADADRASWAPSEGDAAAPPWLEALRAAIQAGADAAD